MEQSRKETANMTKREKEILERAERARAEMEAESQETQLQETQLQETEATQEQEPVTEETPGIDFRKIAIEDVKKQLEKLTGQEHIILSLDKYIEFLKLSANEEDIEDIMKEVEEYSNHVLKTYNISKEKQAFFVPKESYIQAYSVVVYPFILQSDLSAITRKIYDHTEDRKKYDLFYSKTGRAIDLENPNNPKNKHVIVKLETQGATDETGEPLDILDKYLNSFDRNIMDIIASNFRTNKYITLHTIYKTLTGKKNNRVTDEWRDSIIHSLKKQGNTKVTVTERDERSGVNVNEKIDSIISWSLEGKRVNGHWTDTVTIDRMPILYKTAIVRDELSLPLDSRVSAVPSRNSPLYLRIRLYLTRRIQEYMSAVIAGVKFYNNNTPLLNKKLATAKKKRDSEETAKLEKRLSNNKESNYISNKVKSMDSISFTRLLQEVEKTEADSKTKKRIRDFEKECFNYWINLGLDSWPLISYTVDPRTYKLTFKMDIEKIKNAYGV